MYTFQQQQKIFKDLLTNNPANKQCADCNTIGPTWASLNFGVFLCSNCSGAHRALGPTITRVKSTKLDQWQKDWMECMQIGNKQINDYWESELGMNKKPRMGASQHQLMKYATEKYVKRKFVKNTSQQDPLTRYKNGTYSKPQANTQTKSQQNRPTNIKIPTLPKPSQIRSNMAVQSEQKNQNLIQFEFPETEKHSVHSQQEEVYYWAGQDNISQEQKLTIPAGKEKSECHSPMVQYPEDDEFSEYTQHGTSFTGTTTENNLTYEELFRGKSNDSGDLGMKVPTMLHHTQSASSIPRTESHHSPHFNVNLNGHTHHVGGHHPPSTLNFKQMYNNPNPNPYQSVGYIPTQQQFINQPFHPNPYPQPHNPYIQPQSQYSMNTNTPHLSYQHQQNSFSNQNYLGQNSNNNLSFNQLMSNQQQQQNLNPHNQQLGGYHNQGYGSHAGQPEKLLQGEKTQEFHWNDYSGFNTGMIPPKAHTQQNASQQQQQQEKKSWVDDWK